MRIVRSVPVTALHIIKKPSCNLRTFQDLSDICRDIVNIPVRVF